MSTDRGRRRAVGYRDKNSRSSSRRGGVQLAPGVRLRRYKGSPEVIVLICAGSKVQLNRGAAAILDLCNGSRSREEIVVHVTNHSGGNTRASDITEFLDAARARGWIVEA